MVLSKPPCRFGSFEPIPTKKVCKCKDEKMILSEKDKIYSNNNKEDNNKQRVQIKIMLT